MREPVYTDRPGCFEEYKAILTAIYKMAGGNPIVDLGVGEGHVTKEWDGVYMDLVVRPTAPGKTMKADILDAPKILAQFNYNLMIMSDVIEHLPKQPARRLLADMDALCKARFIFTPLGPYHEQPNATHPDAHKSSWMPGEFSGLNWEVLAYRRYHIFSGEAALGAFFAWKFRDEPTPTVAEVLKLAGISL